MFYEKVFLVQSLETGDFLFLSPDTGDLGHTKFLHEAGKFSSFVDAFLCGVEEIGEDNFKVSCFFDGLADCP